MRTESLNIGLISIHCFLPCRDMVRLVSQRLSPWRSGFDLGFMAKWHWGRFSSEYFGLPPSSSLQHYMLTILMLLLSEGQSDEAWKSSNKAVLPGCRRTLDREVLSDCFLKSSNCRVSFYRRFVALFFFKL